MRQRLTRAVISPRGCIMQPESHEVIWLEQWQRLSISELALYSGMSEIDLHELVDYGVLTPSNPLELQWAFSADCVVRVRKAGRLRDELELDTHAMALAIMLLDRIDELETQMTAMRGQVPYLNP